MFFKILAEDRQEAGTVELGEKLRVAAEARGHGKATGDEPLGFLIGIATNAQAEVDPARGVPIFLAKKGDGIAGGMWTTHCRLSDFYVMAPFEELQPDQAAVVEGFEQWIAAVEDNAVVREAQRLALDTEVRLAIEEFVTAWKLEAEALVLGASERRTAEALVDMAAELAKDEHPPRGILVATFSWFAEKTNLFVDEFAKAAGKSSGTVAGLGVAAGLGAAATRSPQVVEALTRVIHALG